VYVTMTYFKEWEPM